MKKILCAVIPVIIVSAFGAIVGVWANDRLQDSKIDILMQGMVEVRSQLNNITNILIKDRK